VGKLGQGLKARLGIPMPKRGGETRQRKAAARTDSVAQVRKGKELTCRAYVSAIGEREGGSAKMRNSNEEAYSEGYAKAVRANWASEGGSVL
jgi:hypothetical protein